MLISKHFKYIKMDEDVPMKIKQTAMACIFKIFSHTKDMMVKIGCQEYVASIIGTLIMTEKTHRGEIYHELPTVCFLDKWPQTKCKVSFDTIF